MLIVIDGYNFLDGAGILALEPGKYTLEKSRNAILRVLRAKLSESACRATTVVFDGTEAPIGLPRRDQQFGITILYSARGELADDLIESLIAKHSHPRQLTVVSSDHRIQRAARRRQAKPVDSDVWYRSLLSRSRQESGDGAPLPADDAASVGDVAGWKKTFGDIDLEALEAEVEQESTPRKAKPTLAKDAVEKPGGQSGEKRSEKPKAGKQESDDSPFPEGYGEDVLDQLDKPGENFNPFPKGYGEDLLE